MTNLYKTLLTVVLLFCATLSFSQVNKAYCEALLEKHQGVGSALAVTTTESTFFHMKDYIKTSISFEEEALVVRTPNDNQELHIPYSSIKIINVTKHKDQKKVTIYLM